MQAGTYVMHIKNIFANFFGEKMAFSAQTTAVFIKEIDRNIIVF
jgi:hypothetical protein